MFNRKTKKENCKDRKQFDLRRVLYAPKGYWELPGDEKTRICNGCGAAGKRDYVPDRIFGLDITEVCHIHDYQYHLGENTRDKADADRAFLDNLITMIDISGGWWLIRVLRRYFALKYYRAVKYFGGPAFWQGKI